MQLLDAWKDSLKTLKWQNLKLLLLVTLNSFVQGWRVLFDASWQALIMGLIILTLITISKCIWLTNVVDMQHITIWTSSFWAFNSLLWFVLNLINFVLIFSLLFAWVLAIRPSVEQKKAAYFIAYFKNFWYIVPLFFFIGKVPFFILIFLILFFLDTKGSTNSFFDAIVRALKMSIYNAPVLLIITLLGYWYIIPFLLFGYFGSAETVFKLIESIHESYISFFGHNTFIDMIKYMCLLMSFFHTLYSFLWLPLKICLFTNIYIKKLHDQFGLYFDQPQ